MQGEFETGFERGGQTREHAQLAKTLGVSKLIVAVNKMDDPSVVESDGSWSKARYDEILGGLTPFLKSCMCATPSLPEFAFAVHLELPFLFLSWLCHVRKHGCMVRTVEDRR